MIRNFNLPAELFADDIRPVVTLGMFDGVHLGHQSVLRQTCEWAQAFSSPSVVLTFDIHPRALLDPDGAPPMITSLEHRLKLFEQLGVDGVCVLSFTPQMASMEAEDFVQTVLTGALHTGGLLLGPRAHFGKGRRGNHAYLAEQAATLPFELRQAESLCVDETPVSSTAIRAAVHAGHLQDAARMLGRPASVMGTVVAGKQLGRTLGFPTLNLDPHHELHPPRGVYVTRTRCGDTSWQSITNIGHRPTAAAISPQDVLVESHLFDFDGDLYGQVVEVSFLHYLRAETKFDSLDALQSAIRDDCQHARQWFARTES